MLIKPNINHNLEKIGTIIQGKAEYEALLERIDQTETRLVEIDEEMVEASADYAKIKALNEEKNNLRQHMILTSQDGVNSKN